MYTRLNVSVLVSALLCAAPSVMAQDPKPSGPTMPNIAINCNAFHTVKDGSGDSCWSIAQKYKITEADFYKWNPDVKDDCKTNFWVGYSYCVGVGPMPTSTSTKTTSSTKTSSTSTKTSNSSTTTTSTSTSSTPYSTRHPVTDWNITATTVESNFPPQRTQPGQPANCDDWYLPTAVDSCERIVASHSWLTREDL